MAAKATNSTYRGWSSLKLHNGLIEVQVVPEIGGRIIQLKLDDFEYLWVNDRLAGKHPTSTGLSRDGGWLNYGGSKLWPAPQGWGRDDRWPGPPDGILDGSPHLGSIRDSGGKRASVQLVSQRDKRSGIQFTRAIHIYENTTRVGIDCKMENVDTKPRRWGIWQVTQHNAANRHRPGFDKNIRVYCPINPKSRYSRGYNVIYGRKDNPEFIVRNGVMSARYLHLVGKIGIDCSAGWYSLVNGTHGYAFVEKFERDSGTEYPDGASFELWTQGTGIIDAYGKISKMPSSLAENPYVLETEVLSPFFHLNPGDASYFHTDWYSTKIGGNLPIIDCTNVGVTCKPLVASFPRRKVAVQSARFGVFVIGLAALAFLDVEDNEISRSATLPVSPNKPLMLEQVRKLADGIEVPSGADRMSIIVMDESEEEMGSLAVVPVSTWSATHQSAIEPSS